MAYQVGQVLYVIDSEKNAVLPCQVIEEIVKKTLAGNQVTYKVVFGPANEHGKVMDLANVKGEIHTSLVDVKDVLMKNVTQWVEKHVSKASKMAAAWYKTQEEESMMPTFSEELQRLPEPPVNSVEEIAKSDNKALIEIAPGQFVKAKIQGV